MNQFLCTCALLCAVVLAMTGCATTPQPAAMIPLRVMSYNIHHAEGLDAKVDLERIAKIITDSRADLVALQEVDRRMQRTGRRDMPAELARLTGLTCVFSNNFATQGGEYGNAILSRYPITSTMNHRLPIVTATEPRGLLEAVVKTPAGSVRFFATHLDHRREEADRLAGVKVIEEIAGASATPVIMAGDFNAQPNSETYQRLAETFDDAWPLASADPGFTIPAQAPTRRIDYIFTSKQSKFRPENAEVINTQASDHRPVVIEFEAAK